MTLFDSAGRFVLSEPGRSAAHFNLAFPAPPISAFRSSRR